MLTRDKGCNLHGWAFTHGCPGCDRADDRDLWRQVRVSVLRTRYLPYRAYVIEPDRNLDTVDDLFSGPPVWIWPNRGPIAWLRKRWHGGRWSC